MVNEFFHGTEVTDVTSQLVAVAQVNSGTIALVGVDPDGPSGVVLVKNPVDAAQYGASVFDGRTIPHALDAIFAQGVAQVIVINCFKNAHLTAVPTEAVEVGQGYIVPFAHVPVGDITLKTTDEVPVTLVEGTDYTHNEGDQFVTILTRKTYGINTALTVAYSYFNSASVVANDIIGGIAVDGTRSGIALLDTVYSNFGITPKILIAPVYVELETVADALLAQADKLRARVIIDAPDAETQAAAITSRGPAGDYANFFTVNKRAVGVYPHVYKPDPNNTAIPGQSFPYSAYFAGVWANSINTNGIQRSPSNQPIAGITKTVRDVSCSIGDATSDASVLNAAGIVTVYSAWGTGLRTWGNRNLSFPENTAMDSFMACSLVQDIIDESVQVASLAFQDRELDQALIDTILDSVNSFLNGLIQSKTIIDGSASYDPAKNTSAQLATGQLIIDMSFLPPPPAEHIIFQSFIDISLFSKINS